MSDVFITRRGSISTGLPHPDSPAGRQFDWVSSGVPSPDSPVGHKFDWELIGFVQPDSPLGSQLAWQENKQELSRLLEDLELFFYEKCAGLRMSIPDTALRILYDALVTRIKLVYSPLQTLIHRGPDIQMLIEKVSRPVRWFDPDLQPRLQLQADFALATEQASAIWSDGRLDAKIKLLADIQTLEKRVYDHAATGIARQWLMAQRAGKQQDTLDRWRRQMLADMKALPVSYTF